MRSPESNSNGRGRQRDAPIERLADQVAALERRLDVATLADASELWSIASDTWRVYRHSSVLSLTRHGHLPLVQLRAALREIARLAEAGALEDEHGRPPDAVQPAAG